MSKKLTLITKASGERVSFSAEKLYRSLDRAGAGSAIADKIVQNIEQYLNDGISTRKIYQKAFSMLRKLSKPVAGRYKIKQAIMELGPTGYPFEKFVGEMLKYQGYSTKVGIIVKGHCVSHEVDVEAEKDDKHFMVECKFHNRQGHKCDVKIPLYIKSRFEDIRKQWEQRKGHGTKFHQGWLVTNTRFTEDAIQYGKCAGLELVSWDYPQVGSIRYRINLSGLHPITCLTTLTKVEKQKLLDNMIVLCKEMCENPKVLSDIGITDKRITKILDEGREICATKANSKDLSMA